jgi:hypothetical protein
MDRGTEGCWGRRTNIHIDRYLESQTNVQTDKQAGRQERQIARQTEGLGRAFVVEIAIDSKRIKVSILKNFEIFFLKRKVS